MSSETEDSKVAKKLEAGTVVSAYGSVYELRFPATFYPSEDNPAVGWMVDQWGSRKYIKLVEARDDMPLASNLTN